MKSLKKESEKKEKEIKVLNRLHFINYLYSGCSVPEASKKLGITKVTDYNWLKRCNKDGEKGLIPRFAGGRPSKLSGKEKCELIEILKERDDWTTKEIRNLIHEEFKVEYRLKQVGIILKKHGSKTIHQKVQ